MEDYTQQEGPHVSPETWSQPREWPLYQNQAPVEIFAADLEGNMQQWTVTQQDQNQLPMAAAHVATMPPGYQSPTLVNEDFEGQQHPSNFSTDQRLQVIGMSSDYSEDFVFGQSFDVSMEIHPEMKTVF